MVNDDKFKAYRSQIAKLNPAQRKVFYKLYQNERKKEVKDIFKRTVLRKPIAPVNRLLAFRGNQRSLGRTLPARLPVGRAQFAQANPRDPFVQTNPSGRIPLKSIHQEIDDAANVFP